MDTVNVAVVGCGTFGEVHAAAYASFPRSNLLAVCDLDADRARRAGEKFRCRQTTKIEDIASDRNVHAVSVVTPDHAHVGPCLALAEAGKHLLIEKPLATSVAEAERIVAAVEKAGVLAMVDFQNRYNPAFVPVKEQLQSGRLGRPQMMYLRLSDRIEVAEKWFAWSGRSGPEWFLGSHIADLACWLFAQRPRKVFADGRKDVLAAKGIDCYDSVQIHLSFEDGFATLETSWIVPNDWPMIYDFYATLQTTAGRADVDLANQGTTMAGPDGFARPAVLGQLTVRGHNFGFFTFPIREFVEAVAAGRPSPISVREGLDNVKIIAAARRSIETGQAVELSWQAGRRVPWPRP